MNVMRVHNPETPWKTEKCWKESRKGSAHHPVPRFVFPDCWLRWQRLCLCRLPSLAWKCLHCQKFPGYPDPQPVHPDLSYLGSLKIGERPPRERDGRERCQWAPSTDEVLGSSLANIVYLGSANLKGFSKFH